MSNSSRSEAATRQHVGATLTNEQIVELVKLADPNWKGGVYPSDAAYTRTPEGLVPRGKTAYGDGVLEYLGAKCTTKVYSGLRSRHCHGINNTQNPI